MIDPPSDIKARQSEGYLQLAWDDGSWSVNLPYKWLRGECPCAACKDEWTGARILDPASIPDDIKVADMELVGSYALKIGWSDGHGSGLFTWENLRKLSENRRSATASSPE